jgi:hypothetical protein
MKTQITLNENDIKEMIQNFESRRGNKVIGQILFETHKRSTDYMETNFVTDVTVEYNVEMQAKLPER